MMRINKFNNFLINESNVISDEYINELLIPFLHMGIKYTIGSETTITTGKYSGKSSISIHFDLYKMKLNDYNENYGISDPDIWEFLDEIISLRNRLEDKGVEYTSFDMRRVSWGERTYNSVLTFVIPGEIKIGDIFELEKIFNLIERKHAITNTDFVYGMTKKLDKRKKEIIINFSDSFTERKWKGFIRDMDMTKFDVTINKDINPRFNDSAKVIIKIKK
jgi:hypothetical protein